MKPSIKNPEFIKNSQKIICLIGPPGSGKSLVNDWFLKNTDFKLMITGDLCRELLQEKSKSGAEVRKYLNVGKLLPDESIFKLIKKKKLNNFRGQMLFDGFPRTKPQLTLFFKLKPSVSKFLILECSEKVALERLQGRRICPKCQRVYHVLFLKPEMSGLCDDDEEKLIIRSDDDHNKIPQRMKIYQEKTLPMVEELKINYAKDIITVNSECSRDELHKQLAHLKKIFLK